MKQKYKVAEMETDKLTKILKYCPSHKDKNTVMFTVFPLHGNFCIWRPK